MIPQLSRFLKEFTRTPSAIERKLASRVGAFKKFLGRGSWGAAFEMSTGSVLKLTADSSEARAMEVVHRNPTDYIVHVYDTFRISPRLVSSPLYGIVQEKLLRIDPSFREFVKLLKPRVLQGKYLTGTVVRKYLDTTDELPSEFTDDRIDWLLGVADYLEQHRILFQDLHFGNVMRRSGGGHVLIDLGESKSPNVRLDLVAGLTPAASLIERIVQGSYLGGSDD